MMAESNDLTTVEVGDPLLAKAGSWDGAPSTVIVTKTTATVVHTNDGRKWLRKNGRLSPANQRWPIQFCERTGPKWDAVVEAERVRAVDAKTIDKEIRHSYSWSRVLSYDQIHRIAEILRETP